MSSFDIDTAKVEQAIRHVAATEVMPRFQNLAAGDIREKNPGDFVTVADEASERVLSELLRDILPDSTVVGEEAVSKDASVLDLLRVDAPVWVVDPIDGTYNFSHGRSRFGILVALVHRGKTIYGFAYDAPGNRMTIAQCGVGAQIDGKKLSIVQKSKNLQDLIVNAGGAQAWHFDPIRKLFRDVVNYRCSLHDFMDFYTGVSDAIIHVNKATPWDHAANVLISTEAGAYTAMDQKEYDPTYCGKAFLVSGASPEICADIFNQTYALIKR